MPKRKYRIGDCKNGDILADDIYTEYGQYVVSKNTEINEYIKEKLVEFGIEYINLLTNQEQETRADTGTRYIEEVKRDYREKVESIKHVLNGLVSGGKLDVESVNEISDSIYSEVYSNFGIIECINQVRTADEYTYTHCINVSLYSMLIARWMGMDEASIKEALKSGLLHDIGKSRIPNEILNKQGPLDDWEYEVMKKHPVYGFEILEPAKEISEAVKNSVLTHHERENGSGYPLGLEGNEIGIYSKIVAVADIYDAMTSQRIYKPKMTPFDTFREIERVTVGTDLYDIKILLTFLTNISIYYTGSKVRLSGGKTGEVVYIPPYDISRPVIKVENEYINLNEKREYKILEML